MSQALAVAAWSALSAWSFHISPSAPSPRFFALGSFQTSLTRPRAPPRYCLGSSGRLSGHLLELVFARPLLSSWRLKVDLLHPLGLHSVFDFEVRPVLACLSGLELHDPKLWIRFDGSWLDRKAPWSWKGDSPVHQQMDRLHLLAGTRNLLHSTEFVTHGLLLLRR